MSRTDGLEVIWYRLWYIWLLGLVVIAAIYGAFRIAQGRAEALAAADRLRAEKLAGEAQASRVLAAQQESVAVARRIADRARSSLALEAARSAAAERARDSAESARLREAEMRITAEASARRSQAAATAIQRRLDSLTRAERNRNSRSQPASSGPPPPTRRIDPVSASNKAVTAGEAWSVLAQMVRVKWTDAESLLDDGGDDAYVRALTMYQSAVNAIQAFEAMYGATDASRQAGKETDRKAREAIGACAAENRANLARGTRLIPCPR